MSHRAGLLEAGQVFGLRFEHFLDKGEVVLAVPERRVKNGLRLA